MVHQIVYLSEVRNKGRVVRRIMIRVNKDKGLYGEFEKRNPNNMEEGRGPAVFYLNNEDLGILPTDRLFEEFNKIFFPKVTNFFDKRMMEKTPWYLTVDKVEYFGNSEPEFYKKIVSLLKIKIIENHMARYYQ